MYSVYAFFNDEAEENIRYVLFAFSQRGVILWNKVVVDDFPVSYGFKINPMLGANGEIYLPTPVDFQCRYSNGNLKWNYVSNIDLENDVFYASVFCNGGIVATQKTKLRFFDVNGNLIWTYDLNEDDLYGIEQSYLLVDRMSNIYVCVPNTERSKNMIYKIEPNMGAFIWKTELPTLLTLQNKNAFLISNDQSIVLVCYDGLPNKVMAYLTSTGLALWSAPFSVFAIFTNMVMDRNDNVYLPNLIFSNLFVFNWRTFDPVTNNLPSNTIQYGMFGTQILVTQNCVLISGNAPSNTNIIVKAVNFSGTVLWTETVTPVIDGAVIATELVLDSNGTLYVNVTFANRDEIQTFALK
jgi:hypothetical protein